MTVRVMIMAGGTGGHVFPALAVASALRESGAEVFWMGTRRGLEADLVPAAGIEMEWVSIAGLRGNGLLGWLLAPGRLCWALLQALAIIMRRRPMAILGMGGFVAGPGGVMSWLLKKPLLIHEQNAIAGLTNRLLARLANPVVEAFPGTFSTDRHALALGNPVRGEIVALPQPAERLSGRTGALRLLIVGGSRGAQALNEALPLALTRINGVQRPEVWHQTGAHHIESTRALYREVSVTARIEPFIDDMAEAYAWADLVVCRSGALTVSELAAAGVAALLIPYPHAVDDHQRANGAYLVEAGAALLIVQQEMDIATLQRLLTEFCDDCASGRQRLLQMATAARQLAQPDAALKLAQLCLEAANG